MVNNNLDKKYENTQFLIYLLAKFGVNTVVHSPGYLNSEFARLGQNKIYNFISVVDERSAAYTANGIAKETKSPVVISCTGATASRNFLPGLTEAFYSKIPIIAITFFRNSSNSRNLAPQFIDRSNFQNDVVIDSFKFEDFSFNSSENIIRLNEILTRCINESRPIHIEFPYPEEENKKVSSFSPERINFYTKVDRETSSNLSKELKSKKIGIFLGSNQNFSKELFINIDKFTSKNDAVVFYDILSNNRSKKCIKYNYKKLIIPDLIIDLGGVSPYGYFKFRGVETWRVGIDNIFIDRFNNLTKVFQMKPEDFFKSEISSTKTNAYFKKQQTNIPKDFIVGNELPLSNLYVANKTSSNIPKNSNLHLSILNSLRCANYFNFDKSINVYSNVGGFGIDGPVSTLIGHSLANPKKLNFGIFGDLAFFYDMNSISRRNTGQNVRIIVVNNNEGIEFQINKDLKNKKIDISSNISAKGHYGSVKHWVESQGFEYLSAHNTEEFNKHLNFFFNPKDYTKPILLEVFTKKENELVAFEKMSEFFSQ